MEAYWNNKSLKRGDQKQYAFTFELTNLNLYMQKFPSPHLQCGTSPCFQKQREECIYAMLTNVTCYLL